MTYDFSFDGKSLWGLLGGTLALCALLFFAGLLVGVGWSEKREAAAVAKGEAASAQTAAQPVVQPVAAQPASVAFAPRAAPPQEPVLYDDPARQQYAASGYGAQEYGPRDYAPQGGGAYGPPAYYGAQRYPAQSATANAAGASAGAAGANVAAPAQTSAAQSSALPGAYATARREAERLSARGLDSDPRLVEESGGAGHESAGAQSAPGYAVQVGAYLEEREARRLVDELENKGYTPTLFSGLDAEARTWYAVRIGSYSNTKDAGQAASNFERQEKRKTAVRPAGSL
jgi:cell division protein FtsN